MPSKNAWPVPRRRRVVGVRIQKWWFYGINRWTLVLVALGLFKLSINQEQRAQEFSVLFHKTTIFVFLHLQLCGGGVRAKHFLKASTLPHLILWLVILKLFMFSYRKCDMFDSTYSLFYGILKFCFIFCIVFPRQIMRLMYVLTKLNVFCY